MFLQVTVTYNDAQALDDPDTADNDEAVDRDADGDIGQCGAGGARNERYP